MFTGLVQAVGRLHRIERRGEDARMGFTAPMASLGACTLGDSIAVNGVCLTAVSLTASGFEADVSNETLRLTALAGLESGSPVNLEPSLTLSTPLGGHLVSGHVDGVGEVIRKEQDGRSWRFGFRLPAGLARYVARKGSIAIDGVSLTVNTVDGDCFAVNIVPHTYERTIMAGYRVGTAVNIEVDLLARYLERLMLGEAAERPASGSGLTAGFLAAHGFPSS